jgi:hypothetical protein
MGIVEPSAALAPLGNELGLLIQAFGPVAFGVIALLIIWARIVGPELAAQRQMMLTVAQLTADLKVSIDRLEIMAETRSTNNVR